MQIFLYIVLNIVLLLSLPPKQLFVTSTYTLSSFTPLLVFPGQFKLFLSEGDRVFVVCVAGGISGIDKA